MDLAHTFGSAATAAVTGTDAGTESPTGRWGLSGAQCLAGTTDDTMSLDIYDGALTDDNLRLSMFCDKTNTWDRVTFDPPLLIENLNIVWTALGASAAAPARWMVHAVKL